MNKFQMGEVVKTLKGAAVKAEGPVVRITEPTQSMKLLWGDDEPHYLIRDNQTEEYISVIERGLEKA